MKLLVKVFLVSILIRLFFKVLNYYIDSTLDDAVDPSIRYYDDYDYPQEYLGENHIRPGFL